MSINEHTGDQLKTKPITEEFSNGYDKIDWSVTLTEEKKQCQDDAKPVTQS
jgi:hypothetical protein